MRACALLACLTPSVALAQADDDHYQTLLVGDRSMGMGTAFTGLANDGSAVYYNPAGLAFREGAAITGGFWLAAYDRSTVEDAVVRDFGDFDLVSRKAPSFPTFVSTHLALGRKKPDGRRPFVLGLSSFRARTNRMSSTVEMENPVTGLTDTVDVDRSQVQHYYGLSLGWRTRRLLGAGVSAFLAHGDEAFTEQAFVVGGLPAPNGADHDSGLAYLQTLGLRSFLLVLRLGLLHQVNERLRLGLMLQPPGIPLRARGNLRYQRLTHDLAGSESGRYVFQRQRGLAAHRPIPAELRGGSAWSINERWIWTNDLSVVMPLPDKSLVEAVPQSEAAERLGIFVDFSTRRTAVANVATGVEGRFGSLLLRMGAFTNFSSGPRVPASAQTYHASRVHKFGLTTSIGVRGVARGLAIGFSAVLGRGQALSVALDDTNHVTGYVRTLERSRTFFVSLTGALETAAHLARAAAEKVAPEAVEGGAAPTQDDAQAEDDNAQAQEDAQAEDDDAQAQDEGH